MENNKYLREEIIRMSGVNTSKCMKCGKCSATCPAYDEMEYHPHQFVGMVETGDIEPSNCAANMKYINSSEMKSTTVSSSIIR